MKSFIFSLFVFVALTVPLHAFGSVPRVSISPVTTTLTEGGTSQTLSITLDEPIIAETGEAYATINLTGDDPRLSISPSSLTFHAGDWATPQSFAVSVNNDYTRNTNNTTHVIARTTSNSEYYSNFQSTATVNIIDAAEISTTRSGGIYYSCRDPKATNYESYGASNPSACLYTVRVPESNNIPQKSDLELGMKGSDVKSLQTFLIKENKGPKARLLSTYGATSYFGLVTKAALIEWQLSQSIATTGILDSTTRERMAQTTSIH